ncbi:MAG TPA: tRNA dihydrouridine synthase DusB [Methylocella sp.]|jgi:tRNA-dihydrouridine synthase B|nr:tRNA dihydrouridine synthase DusB [Methylocella sp.]
MTDLADNLGSAGGTALQIGGLRLDGRAFLAPMAGVTDLGMRRLAHRFGASLTVSEMVAAGHYARGDAANRLKAEGGGAGFHAVQIAGRDPYVMAEAARLAQDSGAAMIDINMGCPAKNVTGGYAGSHLMRDLGLAVSLIRATIAAVRIPVTLKMRLGWDGQSLNAPELGRLAEAEGIAMLTVHGRTRCQFYSAQADWTAIGKVKQAVSIPVTANGDCASLADAVSILAQSGADAVMIGRSAIGRPWFVGDVAYYLAHGKARAKPPPAERKSAALEHYETLLEMFGTGQGVRHARKHLAAYAARAGVQDGVALRQRLVGLECPGEVRSTLCQLFDSPSLTEAA